jgi:LysM repeat protein
LIALLAVILLRLAQRAMSHPIWRSYLPEVPPALFLSFSVGLNSWRPGLQRPALIPWKESESTMRPWTKSAYVVVAWSSLSVTLTAVALHGAVHLTQADTRTAISNAVVAAGTLSVAAPVPGTSHTMRYVVQPGDTLSEIAAQFAVRGGWPALYAANRRVIGPDRSAVRSGTVLTLPGPRASTPPGSVRSHLRRRQPASPQSRFNASRSRAVPAAREQPALAGMPEWLKTLLLAVGLLILGAFLAEPVLAAGRRQWRSHTMRLREAAPNQEPNSRRPCASEANIVMHDHDRLVVTCSTRDDTVYVLRPPNEDPKAILRVARLVLPEDRYRELAEQLGLKGSWPMRIK